MPNIIELNLLNNKSIVAKMQDYPLGNENSYKIIAGEENATQFSIMTKPAEYDNATYYVEMVNAKGGGIDKKPIIDDTFKLPKGMAVEGYAYVSISCVCDITSTTVKGAVISTDYARLPEYGIDKTFAFVYDGDMWNNNGGQVDLLQYGITINNELDVDIKAGDKIVVSTRANVLFQPLKIKVWNTIPQWQDFVDKTTNVRIDNGYLILTENGNEYNLGYVQGSDGETPYIGENGNWFIGDTDTGVLASGGATEEYVNQQIDNAVSPIKQEIDDLYLLSNATVTGTEEVSGAYSARQTSNGLPDLIDGALTKVTEIKGSTVRCENLITYPYLDTTMTLNGITFTDNGDGTITVNGTATAQAYFVVWKGTLPIGDYFLSGKPKDGVANNNIYIANSDYSLYKTDTGSGVGFTIEKEEKLTIAISIASGNTVSNLVFKLMLKEGTTEKPYQPYFSGLKSASISSIKSTGWNLFNPNRELVNLANEYSRPETVRKLDETKLYTSVSASGYTYTGQTPMNISYADGVISFTSKSPAGYGVGIPFRVKPNTTYAFSYELLKGESVYVGVSRYTKDGVFIFFNTQSTFTTPSNCEWVIVVVTSQLTNTDISYTDIQLVEAETELPYKPYIEETYQLPQTLELGEWDSFKPQTGELVKGTSKQIVLTGEENWMVSDTQTSGKMRFCLENWLNERSAGTISTINSISSVYDSTTAERTYLNTNGLSVVGKNVWVYDETYATKTVAEWKAHLAELKAAGTPLMVEYKLETPTTETLENVPKRYTAWKNGTETIEGNTNEEYGALPTITNIYAVKKGV